MRKRVINLLITVVLCYLLATNISILLPDAPVHSSGAIIRLVSYKILGAIFFVLYSKLYDVNRLQPLVRNLIFACLGINLFLGVGYKHLQAHTYSWLLFGLKVFESLVWNAAYPLIKYAVVHEVHQGFLISCFFLCNINGTITSWMYRGVSAVHGFISPQYFTIFLVLSVVLFLEILNRRLWSSRTLEDDNHPHSAAEFIESEWQGIRNSWQNPQNRLILLVGLSANVLTELFVDKEYVYEAVKQKKAIGHLLFTIFNIAGGMLGIAAANKNLKRSFVISVISLIISSTLIIAGLYQNLNLSQGVIMCFIIGFCHAVQWKNMICRFNKGINLVGIGLGMVSSLIVHTIIRRFF